MGDEKIYTDKEVFIRSINPKAENALVFAHGGIREDSKEYLKPTIVPPGKTLIYYSSHSEDTHTAAGWRLAHTGSTYDSSATGSAPKNINPSEFVQAGEGSFNYKLNVATEGYQVPPSRNFDVVGITGHVKLSDVMSAIAKKKPEIRYVHAFFCRGVYDKQRARSYYNEPMSFVAVQNEMSRNSKIYGGKGPFD
ncbi:putative adhesin [Pseudomonas sp. NPDC090755]|uniref:putative adhesin n=1 Tax=Pseudomonas sp. NPDC090755 TaxID=3364481 RepID=UPI00383AA55D